MPTLLRMSVRELKARLGQSYRNGGNGHSAMPVQSRQGRGKASALYAKDVGLGTRQSSKYKGRVSEARQPSFR